MGARGKTRQLGDRISIRFRQDAETQIRVLAAMWSTSVPEVVRILTSEALTARHSDGIGVHDNFMEERA